MMLKMPSYTCYIDESGNTKELYWDENGPNFKDQPYFCLGLIGLPSAIIPELEEKFFSLKSQFHIQSPEPKGKDIYKTNKDFMTSVIQFLIEKNAFIMCELTEKKFFLVAQITNFLLNVSLNEPNIMFFVNVYANALYQVIDDHTYSLFCKLCRERTEGNYYSFLNYFQKLIENVKSIESPYIEIYNNFSGIISEMITEKENYDLYLEALPIIDINKRGKDWSSIPNIPSLSNLIMRTNFILKGTNPNLSVKFVHDEESHLNDILKANIELLKEIDVSTNKVFNQSRKIDSSFVGDIDLIYAKSKDTVGIQVADFVTAAVTNSFHDFVRNIKSKNDLAEQSQIKLNKAICNFIDKINFVMPDEHIDQYSSFLYSESKR